MAGSFRIDPRIEADSVAVAELRLSHVRLMDDARFPWLLLLPRRAGLVEWTELAGDDLATLAGEISLTGAALRQVEPFDKLNVGALGNIVAQMHVHVVGRRIGDAAWPGPVWGSGVRQPYAEGRRAELAERLRAALSAT